MVPIIPIHAQLDDAVNTGDLVTVQSLLARGADVNSRNGLGDTPLIAAAWIGAADIVRFLVEHGADVDAIGFQGKTALELAKSIGHIDVARMLNEEKVSGPA